MAGRDILAIGASAGGLEALWFLASRFPPNLPASVLITMHLSSEFHSNLDAILNRSGPLGASFAADGEALQQRHIYIAPTEHHLIVDADRLALGVGPRENHARPAIDPMFRSIAGN